MINDDVSHLDSILYTDDDIDTYSWIHLKMLRGETLETDGHILIVRNSMIGTFHLPRSDENEQDHSNVSDKSIRKMISLSYNPR
jgi:hypothetical protein